MGETADQTRRELESLRSEIEEKVIRLRGAFDSSVEAGAGMSRTAREAALAAGAVAVVGMPVLAAVLTRRARRRARLQQEEGLEQHQSLGSRLLIAATNAAAAAAAAAVVQKALHVLDERRDARHETPPGDASPP